MAITNNEKQARYRRRQRELLDWYEAITGIDRKQVLKMIKEKDKKNEEK